MTGTDAPADLAPLLAPIEGASATGQDIGFSPIVRAIGEARRAENARLPQGVWTREVKRADWPTVEQLCVEALGHLSKDLQIAAWLTEAWVHLHGVPGLTDGLRLLAALSQQFWPALHPAIEDGDLTARVAPFEWLNARIPPLLRDQPIVCAPGDPPRVGTWTDYVNAQLLEALRQRDPRSVERAEAAGEITLAAFGTLRERTEMRFLAALDTGLADAAAALAALNAVLEEACGREAPGLGGIASAIADIRGMTSAELGERHSVPSIPLPPAPLRGPAVAEPRNAVAPDTPPTRAHLYAQLSAISDALYALEPHSPVPYLIRCAVEWGDLPLSDLLERFSEAGFDAGAVFALLGLGETLGAADEFHSDVGAP